MERGVRQGCPLAPYLYLFVADVHGDMINDPRHSIEGLRMPNGSILRETFFADDTNFYFKGTTENMTKVCKVLDRFC